MATAVLLSLACKILATIASKAFVKAYKKSSSIWGARKDLEALEETIHTIQAKLQVAEQMQDGDATVKDWMERIGDVLHEADDLFDEVATNELLKQQMGVKVHFSKLHPVISNHSIAKKVERIRQDLERISKDTSFPNPGQRSQSGVGSTGGTAAAAAGYVNPQGIVGREKDQKSICEFLLNKKNASESTRVPVIAIVGIGGIGKTTLAQLIFGDKDVEKEFEKRWWVCIPNTIGETQVLLQIFESIQGKSYEGDINQLTFQIKNLVTKTKEDPRNYLLILDGVRDQNISIWYNIITLLSSGAKGSKVIVTTRNSSVATAMHAIYTCNLGGLSTSSSRELFKRIAFPEGQLNDYRRNALGEKILDKCANNPLAIKNIAALLISKPSIEEWESIRYDPNLQCQCDDSIISRLRVSFNYLEPEVKSCFAYCSLFPKRYEIVKEELIYLWVAQGYVNPKEGASLEAVGNGYFNQLLRMYFFEELKKDKYGELIKYKMHDLFHQLAQEVAGVQSVILTKQGNQFHKRNRHLTVGYEMNHEWTIPESLLIADRLRSSLFIYRGSLSPQVLDKLFTEFKYLRALNLEDLKLGQVPDSLGDLKHLRYLNLSKNTFKSLPNSMSRLVNLLTLDISCCEQLQALPDDFRKLINLSILNAKECCYLMNMPPRFRELTSLEYLSYFNVGQECRTGGYNSRFMFDMLRRKAHKDRAECHQLPRSVRVLKIQNPTMTMLYWDRKEDIPSLFPNLVKLHIFKSETVDRLPPFRCLSSLKDLRLSRLEKLQYIEENEESDQDRLFFPSLEELTLEALPNLKGWFPSSQSIAANNMPHFPSLLNLRIEDCQKLESIPLFVRLQTLELRVVAEELVQQLLSEASSHSSSTINTPLSPLTTLSIARCNWSSFRFESLTLLQYLQLENCSNLESLYLVQMARNILEELQILNCPKLLSYGLNETEFGNWNSFPKLRLLIRNNISIPRKGD